jgi:hypothetical protein
MLACNEFAAAFFAHRSGTQGTVGFVSRHLGKEAFEKKNHVK